MKTSFTRKNALREAVVQSCRGDLCINQKKNALASFFWQTPTGDSSVASLGSELKQTAGNSALRESCSEMKGRTTCAFSPFQRSLGTCH